MPTPPPLPSGSSISAMLPTEMEILREWAHLEGWNPGLHDIDLVWRLDPDAFLALRHDGELVGGGTILSYDGTFGFMGLFIVRPDRRGRGLGTSLWFHRRDALLARLRPGAVIGMDGVFDMAPFYERGGFELAYRDLRFDGTATGVPDDDVVEVASLPFTGIDDLDARHFPTRRSRFLHDWLAIPGAQSLAIVEHDRVVGFGATRPCSVGHRFGPVIAERSDVAERLLGALMVRIDGEPVQLDVPECNERGLELASAFGMVESFGCARMYLGGVPDVGADRIYGVTSFEFG